MASLSTPPSPTSCFHTHHRQYSPTSIFSSPVVILPFSSSLCKTASLLINTRLRALKFGADGSDLLRKPVSRPPTRKVILSDDEEDEDESVEEVDWEDQILEDTVPLVGFVRMLIHSDRYESGERLSEEHEQTIREKLLPFHPECANKIGCGIDYITVGYHPDFEGSRCLFIARKDGELVDFSYWKCIKGLIKKNYPLYADTFILRHFRRHRQRE